MISEIIITVVAFLIVLAIVIVAHELGHFATAKAFGVKVEEFGIGFPPRIFSVKRGETRYSLNAIPLGGFTKMAGEEDPSIPRSLASKSRRVRLLVLGAGSLMNAILPIVLFSVAFMVPHDILTGQVVVQEVAAESPAAAAGIQSGDVILSMDSKPVRNLNDVSRYIQLNLGTETTMLIKRADATEEVRITPRWKSPAGQGATGIAIELTDPVITRQSYPFWEAVPMGVTGCIDAYVLFKNGIQKWLIGADEPRIAGPVGIAQLTGEVAQAGVSPLLEFTAFLTINLAILNLFPIPGLDGGRIVFVLLEWVRRGRRISPRTEGLVHLIGFAVLIAIVLNFTYFDILRIASGGSLIP